jgi:EAL domain-containing protein (putative c-di-GMP-specific phosphodiesterase class I)
MQIRVAVNLSTRCLHDPCLLQHLDEVIDDCGMPPEMLELEITESAVMTEPLRSQQVLAGLKERGVRLSIDDFGTGHASLAYLKDLPVDTVKIDKSFVKPMGSRSKDMAIVRYTIELGHELGLRVVAEGVEDQATWDLLVGLGCDAAQGWHLGMPSPASIIPAYCGALVPSARSLGACTAV